MVRAAVETLENGELAFALSLRHLHPDRELDAAEVARDGVALVTALEGQRDARFVLQTVCTPDPRRPERGRLDIHVIAVLSGSVGPASERVDELNDDLLDLLAAPPVRWSFEPVTDADALASVLSPIDPRHLAEVARREEPCPPMRWTGGLGFGADPAQRRGERPLWSMWTFGPPSRDLRRLSSVLLAQEAPVCIRVSLAPSSITPEERAVIEALARDLQNEVPPEGLLRASLHTIESLLYLRPLFDVRCVAASPEPLSPALLSALGHAYSEPPVQGSADRVLRGGFAVLRADHEVDGDVLSDAFSGLSAGRPNPSLAPPGLERIRRLLGPWEAANLFRIPATDDDWFPGVDTLRVPDLEVPLADLARTGQRVGHLVGNVRAPVLIDAEERFRHLYVSGQTGTGKSTLLMNLALQDIESGAGVAVLDPHGDLVDAILGRIPQERLDDVVLIDPADPDAVVGVNLLEADSPVQSDYVVSELASMFYALFDPNRSGIIGPRYESWLRQAALLLLAHPEQPSSFLDISTVFVDPAVRRHLTADLDDPILAEFWRGEMEQTTDFHRSEVLGWFRSKFEVFRTSSLVRNVVGQARSTVSFADVLANQRILLVNLSKGLLGQYNSGLIGHIVFSRLWSAALERGAMAPGSRSDFFVYLDEFQNMTSESLPAVLSEARKFRVGVTLANQFFTQVPENTRDAIMGNVGSRITFRLGPKDAAPFAHWLGTEVQAADLTTLPNHVAIGALSDQGIPLDPFPFRTEPPSRPWDRDTAATVRSRSRSRWAVPVERLDVDFFGRWAHVPGSFSQRVLDDAGRGVESDVPEADAPTTTFVRKWILDRLLHRPLQPYVEIRIPEPPPDLLRAVGLLRRRVGLGVPEAVRRCLEPSTETEELLPFHVGLALRFELRCLGSTASLTPSEPAARHIDDRDVVADLDLPSAILRSLDLAGVHLMPDLLRLSANDLASCPGIGVRSVERIRSALASRGLRLADVTDGGIVDDDMVRTCQLDRLRLPDLRSLIDAADAEYGRRLLARLVDGLDDETATVIAECSRIDPAAAESLLDDLVPDHRDQAQLERDRLRAELTDASAEILRELAPPDRV